MSDFKVEILSSSRELSLTENLKIITFSGMKKLDSSKRELESVGEELVIDFDFYAVLKVHNEKSKNTDYEVFAVADKNGDIYTTGSQSFFNQLSLICDACKEYDVNNIQIAVDEKDSSNYSGKYFLTCHLISAE